MSKIKISPKHFLCLYDLSTLINTHPSDFNLAFLVKSWMLCRINLFTRVTHCRILGPELKRNILCVINSPSIISKEIAYFWVFGIHQWCKALNSYFIRTIITIRQPKSSTFCIVGLRMIADMKCIIKGTNSICTHFGAEPDGGKVGDSITFDVKKGVSLTELIRNVAVLKSWSLINFELIPRQEYLVS